MEIDTIDCEVRIPVEYDVPTDGLSHSKLDYLQHTKKLLESELFTWGQFPINPPESKLRNFEISMDDLFKVPDLNEMAHLARGPDRNQKPLSPEQLSEIRKTGKFSVPSENFLGRNHVITLNWLIQKGSDAIMKTFRRLLSISLRQFIIEIPDRVKDPHGLSIFHGIKKIKSSIWNLVDLIFGCPSFIERNINIDVHLEIRKNFKKFFINGLTVVSEGVYRTEEGEELDFLLWVKFLEKTTNERLGAIVKEEERVWLKEKQSVRVELFNKLKGGYKGEKDGKKREEVYVGLEIEEEMGKVENSKLLEAVEDATVQERNRRFLKAVRTDEFLKSLDPRLPEFAYHFFCFYMIYTELISEQNIEIEQKRTEITNFLKIQYPIRSLINRWLNRTVNREMELFNQEIEKRPSILSRTLSISQQEGIKFFPYLLQKHIEYIPTEKKYLEIEKVKEPSRTYEFKIKIWNPKNWHVHTIENNQKPPTYYAVDYDVLTVTAAQPGYRILQFLARTWKWWKNIFFWLVFVFLINGPLSFRALFSVNAYYPSSKIDPTTGALVVDDRKKVETYMSRIWKLWKHISKSRDKFEAAPDDGIVGKSFSRLFNWGWNYIAKGFFGTTLLLIGFPTLCILNYIVTITIIFLAPIWGPSLGLCQYLCCLIIYDFDNPQYKTVYLPYIYYILWRYIISGLFQILLSILSILILHPLVAYYVTYFAILRTTISTLTDLLTFYLILHRIGRVPASDSFLSHRTEGPGLNQNWYYQVSTDMTLLALQAHLEKEELKQYCAETERRIDESIQMFNKIEKEIFSPFGLKFDYTNSVYKKIVESNHEIREQLKKETDIISFKVPHFPNNVKQSASALVETLQKGTFLVQEFYTQHIFKLMTEEQIISFWVSKYLAPDDWTGLTKHIFNTIFSGNFLTPLEEDKSFSLEVSHVSLKGFVDMMITAQPRDDLELQTAVFALFHSTYQSRKPLLNLTNSGINIFHINFNENMKEWFGDGKKDRERETLVNDSSEWNEGSDSGS